MNAAGTVGDTSGIASCDGCTDPPAPRSLSLAAAFPNPGSGEALTFAVALPDDSPAQLSLLDAQGRALASAEVSARYGLRTTVTLRPSVRPSPGVYLVRLRQSGRTATVKVTLRY